MSLYGKINFKIPTVMKYVVPIVLLYTCLLLWFGFKWIGTSNEVERLRKLKDMGKRHKVCYPNKTCNTGLKCNDNICVKILNKDVR